MSEEPKEAKPEGKKKSKLPVMIALVAVLAGGGFFGMKMRGGGKKEGPPPIKLGEVKAMDEFLVNLRDGGRTFARVGVALHLRDTFKAEEMEAALPAVKDAIVTTLSAKTPTDVGSIEGKLKLRRDIAAAVNKALDSVDPKKAEEEAKKKAAGDKKDESEPKAKVVIHKDWDSQEGPVLKVYFTSFATQQS